MRAPGRRLLLCLTSGLLLASVALTQAQADGHLCLRAFEDRDADGSLDSGEPLLTAGVNAELRDEAGLVVAGGQMDGSPTAAQGVLCFQFLQPGDYTLLVSSPARTATGDARFPLRIEADAPPQLVDYGAGALTGPAPSTAADSHTGSGAAAAQNRPGHPRRAAGDDGHALRRRPHRLLRPASAPGVFEQSPQRATP